METYNYSIELTLRIDWSELDYFKHVNNVSFFKYIQAARVNYWDSIGLTELHNTTNIGAMLASCKCDFKKPLFYPGSVRIRSYVGEIRNSSFTIHHHLFNDKDEIVAIAQDIVVVYDFNENKKSRIPEELRKSIEQLEKNSL